MLLAAAGCADVISAVFRSTIIQLAVPDALRGRLAGLQIAVVTGGPRVGDLEAGAVAAAFGDTVSVVSGGLACIAGPCCWPARCPGSAASGTWDPARAGRKATWERERDERETRPEVPGRCRAGKAPRLPDGAGEVG